MLSKDFLRCEFQRNYGIDCNLDKDGYIDYLEGKLCDPLQNTSSNSDYAKLPTRDDIIAHLRDKHEVKYIRCDVIDSTIEIIRKLGNFA